MSINGDFFYLIFRESKAKMQMTEANFTDNTPHEYEVLDKYTKEYEDIAEMDLTECPAYVPTRQPKT